MLICTSYLIIRQLQSLKDTLEPESILAGSDLRTDVSNQEVHDLQAILCQGHSMAGYSIDVGILTDSKSDLDLVKKIPWPGFGLLQPLECPPKVSRHLPEAQ